MVVNPFIMALHKTLFDLKGLVILFSILIGAALVYALSFWIFTKVGERRRL
jgi:HAMP domain-containing protein